MFELTVHFKHEMIGFLPNIHSNFELTVFELTVPDLYTNVSEKAKKFVYDQRILVKIYNT